MLRILICTVLFMQKAGLLERSGGELQHLISDAATMQLIRWTDGGFGMAAHNYDGDVSKYASR